MEDKLKEITKLSMELGVCPNCSNESFIEKSPTVVECNNPKCRGIYDITNILETYLFHRCPECKGTGWQGHGHPCDTCNQTGKRRK